MMPRIRHSVLRGWVAASALAAIAGVATAQDQQTVTPVPGSLEASSGDRVAATIEYSTSTGTEGLTGLGLRLHWASSALAVHGVRSVLGAGLVAQGQPEPDSGDFDGNPATDTFLQIAWADLAGGWPGSATADLFTIDFDVLQGFSGSTRVGFSASSTAVGYILGSTPLRINEPGASGCVPGDETLCLGDGRFEVTVDWRDFDGDSGRASVVPAGSSDSGLFWFFDAENWEMLVKVLDGCSINGNFWVLAAATTNVELTLRVTDRVAGTSATYTNPLGSAPPALIDTSALQTCTAMRSVSGDTRQPQQADSIRPWRMNPSEAARSRVSTVRFDKDGECVPSATNLCLERQRFRVEVDWRDGSGVSGAGQVVPVGSEDSGLFWFFDPSNWEMLVKVLDGCALNGKFWVFSALTTDVGFTLRVTDDATGAVREYINPPGRAADAIIDTSAFSTCPEI